MELTIITLKTSIQYAYGILPVGTLELVTESDNRLVFRGLYQVNSSHRQYVTHSGDHIAGEE